MRQPMSPGPGSFRLVPAKVPSEDTQMGLWRDEVAVLFVRQVTAQALPYAKPSLKRPACCIIVITVTKSQAAQIKPITAHHANQLYQHGTLALLVPGLLAGVFLVRTRRPVPQRR